MIRCARVSLLVALIGGVVPLVPFVVSDAHAAGITAAARLTAIYDDILAARFEQADAQLASACPPAPEVACRALGLASLWWRIVLDPDNRDLDGTLETTAASVIAAAQAWTVREPDRAEAWFYLAGSYGPLVQWRVLRGERIAAARDGNRIRVALERALALDPTLHDALFGIGLYHYYADVAPAAAKVLRFLLLLPGGDRRQGLKEMQTARDQGALLKGEADFQLHYLYLWYERAPSLALELLRRLDGQYPTNPVFLSRIAEIQHEYLHDYPASAASWEQLLHRATTRQVSAPALAETNARLGLSAALDAMLESDRALEPLELVIRARPAAPAGALARAYVQRGEVEQRLGNRDRAAVAFEEAIALTARADPANVRERARSGLRRRVDAAATDAYRLSLEGVRALERGDLPSATAALDRARTLAPGDPVIVSRHARLLVARGESVRARVDLERVLTARNAPPPVVIAAASLDYAMVLERSGERSRAIEYYRRAAETVGGDRDVRSRAEAARKRLAF